MTCTNLSVREIWPLQIREIDLSRNFFISPPFPPELQKTSTVVGLIRHLFPRYIKANGGIDTEASYPYKAQDKKCHFNKANVGATDTGE